MKNNIGRIGLKQFQEDVVAKLNTASATQNAASRLGIVIQQDAWLVNLDDVSEVLPVPVIYSTPLTQPWFRGVVNVRGSLFSVVDMAHFNGQEPQPLNMHSRILLIHARHMPNAALLIDGLLGLRSIDAMSVDTMPEPNMETTNTPAVAQEKPWHGQRYRDAQGRSWQQLDIEALVQQSAFLHVGMV